MHGGQQRNAGEGSQVKQGPFGALSFCPRPRGTVPWRLGAWVGGLEAGRLGLGSGSGPSPSRARRGRRAKGMGFHGRVTDCYYPRKPYHSCQPSSPSLPGVPVRRLVERLPPGALAGCGQGYGNLPGLMSLTPPLPIGMGFPENGHPATEPSSRGGSFLGLFFLFFFFLEIHLARLEEGSVAKWPNGRNPIPIDRDPVKGISSDYLPAAYRAAYHRAIRTPTAGPW